MKLEAKQIVDWLREKLGDSWYLSDKNDMWIEHDYAFGDTESGFYSVYSINYENLLKEMDAWILEKFNKGE